MILIDLCLAWRTTPSLYKVYRDLLDLEQCLESAPRICAFLSMPLVVRKMMFYLDKLVRTLRTLIKMKFKTCTLKTDDVVEASHESVDDVEVSREEFGESCIF